MRRLVEIVRFFTPWIAGKQFSMADIYVHYINAVVGQIGSRELEWDILSEIPGMRDWQERMKDSDIARQVEDERAANVPKFEAYIKEYMGANK